MALSLVTNDGDALSYNQDTLTSATISSTSLSTISGITTTVNMPNAGDMFVALSFNCESSGTSASRFGTWDLQVDGTTIGTGTKRTMQGSNDAGAVTLFALAEDLSAGNHVITVRGATNNSEQTIEFYNATLAGVGLVLDDGRYFPAFQANVEDDVTTTSTTYADAVNTSFAIPDDGTVFLAGSYSTRKNAGTNVSGYYKLSMDGYGSQEVQRYIANSNDWGSGGNVGLTSSLTAGTYEPALEFHTTSGATMYAYYPNLVGFSTTATPEPASAGLALLAAGVGALVARRKRKKTAQSKSA